MDLAASTSCLAGPDLLAHQVRSGLVEATNHGAALALGPRGEALFELGDVDRSFFLRSAIKPFQATVALEAGVELSDEELAVACSSHAGQPAHVAIARSVLAQAGLGESHLQCPPGPALAETSRLRLASQPPSSLHHMCSGKHSAMLAACVATGWPTESYLDPQHPGQVEIANLVEELTGEAVGPPGVDGCGYPTLRGSVRGMARAYQRLMFDSRFRRVRVAMSRYPALVGGSGFDVSTLALAIGGVAKTGAAGLLAVGAPRRFGLAVKAFDGSTNAAATAAAEICIRLGAAAVVDRLDGIVRRPLFGGGHPVGSWEALP